MIISKLLNCLDRAKVDRYSYIHVDIESFIQSTKTNVETHLYPRTGLVCDCII